MSITNENFKNIDKKYRPRLRYWWPGGYVANDLDQLDEEIKNISEAGFGGIEISDVYDSIKPEDCKVLQPEVYGFTSENWKKSVKKAFYSAKKYDIKVDLTASPHWPATTNEANPNEVGTAKELVYGTFSFDDEIDKGANISEICPPHYKTSEKMIDGSEIENKLIALYIAEHVDHKEVEMPPLVPWEESYTVISDDIKFESLKEITNLVKNGLLTEKIITVSDNKKILIAVYERGTGQRSNYFAMGSPDRPDVMAPYAYVINHFSKSGTNLLIKLWEDNFLDEELRALIKEVGDCFFEDSLELKSVGHWTEDILDEFKKRKGYDIYPYLPFVLGINQDKGLSIETASFKVEIEYNNKIEKFRHDYFEVLNELYRDYHVKPIREWANKLGMKFRAQPYGWAIDSGRVAMELDVVEGESLGFGEDDNDGFRILAAGRDFGGHEILSDESGAYLFQGYATTVVQLLTTLHKNMMAGVNQTYWHGMAYKYAPGAKWPGFAAFSPMMGGRGFAEAWGPRQPIWEFLPIYTTYLARVGKVLRYGKNNCDVLLYQDGHNASENKAVEYGKEIIKLGYSYQVMTEGLFDGEVTSENGRLKVKNGSYGVVCIPNFEKLSDVNKEKFTKWKELGVKLIDIKADGLDKIVEVLGKSVFKSDETILITYTREDEKKFVTIYNQGQEVTDLVEFFGQNNVREWNPWTGEINKNIANTILPNELRIFEIVESQVEKIDDVKALRKISLNSNKWEVNLESWEMKEADSFDTIKNVKVFELDNLKLWTDIEGYENLSGIGTYKTTVNFENKNVKTIQVPYVNSTVEVYLNNKKLEGNPLTGEFKVENNLVGENVLEIKVGTTLNNYLNNCPLTEYYGKYNQQDYGIKDVFYTVE